MPLTSNIGVALRTWPNLFTITLTLTLTLSLKEGEGLIRKRAAPSYDSCLVVKRTMCDVHRNSW